MSFDTLTYSKDLVEAGEKPEVAEVHALAMKKMMDDELVTKDHMDVRFKELSNELTMDVKQEIAPLKTDITIMKAELGMIKWMMGGTVFGIFLLVVKTFLA